MWAHKSHGTLHALHRAVLALLPPKVSQHAQQRRGALLCWPLKGAVVVPVSETVCEGMMADEKVVEVVLEDKAVSVLYSAAEFVFDVGAGKQPAFLASEI